MNKRNLWTWALYDFANSFVFINFLLYFSQWLVIDAGLSDFWYNALFPISAVLLLLSAPTLAAFTDQCGGRKYFLSLATFGTQIGYGLATVLAYYDQSIVLIAILFLVGQYFYQLSFCLYNPLIEDVADISHRAKASGIGQCANSIGQLAGLIFALPLSATRLQPLLPSVLVFFVLSMPMLLYFTEQKKIQAPLTLQMYKSFSKDFLKKIRIFFSTSIAIPILASFFFFNDALITVSNNYAIYMEQVFGIPDVTKNILLMIVLFMSALGGLVFGVTADRVGTERTLKWILLSWIVLLPGLAIVQSLLLLGLCSALLGFFMGGIWTVTRAYLSQTLNTEELGYGFSFYTVFERFATFLGPLSWGGLIAILGTRAQSYRIAMMCMTLYVIAGFLVLLLWKRSRIYSSETTTPML